MVEMSSSLKTSSSYKNAVSQSQPIPSQKSVKLIDSIEADEDINVPRAKSSPSTIGRESSSRTRSSVRRAMSSIANGKAKISNWIKSKKKTTQLLQDWHKVSNKLFGAAKPTHAPRKYDYEEIVQKFFVLIGKDGHVWKVINYRAANLMDFPFCPLTGTVLTISKQIWLIVASLVSASASIVFFSYIAGHDAEYEIDGYKEVTFYLNFLTVIFCGLYLELAVARWWMFRKMVMELHDRLYDICQAASASRKMEAEWFHRIERYGLLSQVLLFESARIGQEISFEFLETSGLLSMEERSILAGHAENYIDGDCSCSAIAQIPWVWVLQDIVDAARAGKLDFPKEAFMSALEAQQKVAHVIFALQRQLPFAYLHVITLLVFFTNFTVALKAGVVLYNFICINYQGILPIFAECVFLVFTPLLYQGFLHVGEILENPFEDAILNFPLGTYHIGCQKNCTSFWTASRAEDEIIMEEVQFFSKCKERWPDLPKGCENVEARLNTSWNSDFAVDTNMGLSAHEMQQVKHHRKIQKPLDHSDEASQSKGNLTCFKDYALVGEGRLMHSFFQKQVRRGLVSASSPMFPIDEAEFQAALEVEPVELPTDSKEEERRFTSPDCVKVEMPSAQPEMQPSDFTQQSQPSLSQIFRSEEVLQQQSPGPGTRKAQEASEDYPEPVLDYSPVHNPVIQLTKPQEDIHNRSNGQLDAQALTPRNPEVGCAPCSHQMACSWSSCYVFKGEDLPQQPPIKSPRPSGSNERREQTY